MTEQAVRPSSPGELFLYLWEMATLWTNAERTRSCKPNTAFDRKVKTALEFDGGNIVTKTLLQLIEPTDSDLEVFRGKVLQIMRFLDLSFYRIHPRAVSRAPSDPQYRRVSAWLRDHKNYRTTKSVYATWNNLSLIPRGPLHRATRPEAAGHADTLYDRFTYLSAAPATMLHQGRPISVKPLYVGRDLGAGVAPQDDTRIVFIPVATKANDLIFTDRPLGDSRAMTCTTSSTLCASTTIFNAIEAAGEAMFAIAPEFVVTENEAISLGKLLRSLKASPALTVAGTGLTVSNDGYQAWNESQALNRYGTPLWRQRKIWPAKIDADVAIGLGLPNPGKGKQVVEDTASGSEIVVADIENVGRCVTFICQDIKIRPLVGDVIEAFQPDWVFVPILDRGVGPSRWMQTAAFEHSDLGQSRFLIVSSLSMAEKLGKPTPHFAMAIGPRDISENVGGGAETDRAIKIIHVREEGHPYADLTWNTSGWLQTSVSVQPWPPDP